MATNSVRRTLWTAATAGLLMLNLSLLAGQLSMDGPSALTNWMVAQTTFQQAGGWVGRMQFEPAEKALDAAAASLPSPYNAMAREFAQRLAVVTKQPQSDSRFEMCTKLCADLQDYPSALKLIASKKTSAKDEDANNASAWYFVETGDMKMALSEYERQRADEPVETYRDYFTEQIRLLRSRSTNQADVKLALQFVQEHYLKGLERKADLFGALRELHRILLNARTPQDAALVYRRIMKCLDGLGDDVGRNAWEEKLLGDLKTEMEACARVYYERGLRSFQKKNHPEALKCFGKISAEWPNSVLYGDALYGTGLVFQEQRNYDEAINEFEKIFSSKVNDYYLDPEGAEDYKSYRFRAAMHVSECYEAKKDYGRALEYAQAARDRYPYVSFCSNCLKDTSEGVKQRIARLQAVADKRN